MLVTADWYGLSEADARVVSQEVLNAVGKWRDVARRAGLSASEIDLMEPAFIGESSDDTDRDECGM